MAKKKPLLILQKLKGSQWNIMNNFKPTNQRALKRRKYEKDATTRTN